MANDDLFGLLTGAREAYEGVAKAVADGQDHLAKAVKQAEADANARRLIGVLQDPKSAEVAINSKLSGEAIFRYLKLMSILNKEEKSSLSSDAKGQLLEMIGNAANNPKLSNLSDDQKKQVDTMMKEAGMPVVFTAKPPLQFFSDASSTSGSSGSNKSTGTRGTVKSGVSALNTLTDQGRKTKGPQNGPLASPTPASVSKGSESEQDKKAPTQSPGCATGIRKAFSSCCSYLSNGLSSIIKKLTPDMSKGADLSSEQVREAAPIPVKKQRRKESEEKKVGFFGSVRNALSSGYNKIPSGPEGYGTRSLKTGRYTQLGKFRSPTAAEMAEVGSAGMRDLQRFGSGVREVAVTSGVVIGYGLAGAASITVSDLTPGKRAAVVAGAVLGGGVAIAGAMSPSSIKGGLKEAYNALPSRGDVAQAISDVRLPSLPSPPNPSKWVNKVRGNLPSKGQVGEVGSAVGSYVSNLRGPSHIPWLR